MTAKIQSNLGLIGSYQKGSKVNASGVADLTSQNLYLRTSPNIDVYGYQGSVAHPSHSSTQVTGTIALGTAYANREIYIIIPTMLSTISGGNNISTVSVGGVQFSEVYQVGAPAVANG